MLLLVLFSPSMHLLTRSWEVTLPAAEGLQRADLQTQVAT